MKKLIFALCSLVFLTSIFAIGPLIRWENRILDSGNYFNVYYEYNIIEGDTSLADVTYRVTDGEKWKAFQQCIASEPSDAVCDSCYYAVFGVYSNF